MRVRQSSVPWLTFDIKKMMKERDYHEKHAIKYGSHNNWILYQSARNKVNSMMRKAKSDYFRLKIDASKATDPKAGGLHLQAKVKNLPLSMIFLLTIKLFLTIKIFPSHLMISL